MLQPVRMMILANCPYCHRAFYMMEQLKTAHPEYQAVEFEVIEEDKHPEIADQLDYYYVPTFFVNGEKVHEGVPTLVNVEAVFRAALASQYNSLEEEEHTASEPALL